MKKIITVLLMGQCIALPIHATEARSFMGLGINDGIGTENDWKLNPSLRIGAQINDYHRAYSYLEYDNKTYSTNLVVSYDYFIPVLSNTDWKLFLGASAGLKAAHKEKDDAILGLQTGVNYRINHNFNTEFGYRIHDTRKNWKTRNMSQLDTFYLAIDFSV
ncbi:hypothetical protein C9J22_08880 [Photobacterium phosphoreum]|uniref:outer membrane beta-barrel protein n=1 Tax=Photobacterium phosphoreum TaxID=659 RepID=UPI000D1625D7|nr:outer membrane beta-barrel protein [Photobacterium phosphoreum]PSU70881.1 hypothetical protein C9J22_08880 [Photobacterium phosphoreum]